MVSSSSIQQVAKDTGVQQHLPMVHHDNDNGASANPSLSPTPPPPPSSSSSEISIDSDISLSRLSIKEARRVLTMICNDRYVMNSTCIPRDLIDIIVTYSQHRSRMIIIGDYSGGDVKSRRSPNAVVPTFVSIARPSPTHLSSSSSSSSSSSLLAAPVVSDVPVVQSLLQPCHTYNFPRWYHGTSGIMGDYMYCTFEAQLGRYHIDTSDATFDLAHMNTSRRRPVSTVIHDRFYVAGGLGVASCEWYDPYVDRWSYAPSLNYERYQSAAITLNQRMLVAGGRITKHEYGTDTANKNGCEAYDPRCDTKWQLLAPMDDPRYGFGFAGLSSYTALVVGGSHKHDNFVCEIMEYDSRNDTWMISDIYPLLPPGGRSRGYFGLMDNTLVWVPSLYRREWRDVAFAYCLPLHTSTLQPLSDTWLPLPPPDDMPINDVHYVSAI